MTYQVLLKSLGKGDYAPVYFLQGEEPYFMDVIVEKIEKEVVGKGASSFDMSILYGNETTLREVLIRAKRFPMLGGKQVVIVKEAQGMQGLHRDGEQALLLSYLSQPNPQTLLLFVYKGKTLDKRKKFTKELEKKAVLFTSKKVYEKALPGWITDYVAGAGYTIASEAVYMLVTLVGDQLQVLAQELDKVMLSLEEGETITLPMIRSQVGSRRQFDIFDLQQAIQAHNVGKVWEITDFFAQHSKRYPLLPQVSLLTNLFSKLLILHNLKNATPAHVASKLGVPPYFVGSYIEAKKHYPLTKTIANLGYLHETDLQLKGIGYPTVGDALLLKNLVGKLL